MFGMYVAVELGNGVNVSVPISGVAIERRVVSGTTDLVQLEMREKIMTSR
jgi:hypothetical protein